MKKDSYNRNMDIISGIDEDIIDRNTDKRIEYKSRQGRPPQRKGYVAVIAIAAVIALLGALVLSTILIPHEGQTPVYTGMSVSSVSGADVMYGDRVVGLSAIELLDNDNTDGNNGNHGSNNPSNKPIGEIVDEDAEYTDDPVGSPDGSLEIIHGEGLYYAKPGEEIYITVHFHNPDDYTITAFKINGIPYASYMFEDGSDMENIIIKVRVPENAEGIVDYTIDSIQYIDRETPKYVVMNGDPTLSIGVYSERQPSATVTNEVIGINDLTFDVDLTDELSLIALFGGNVQAIITDGNEIIEMRELKAGESTKIKFEGLKTSSYYNYAIVATYDALDGAGFVPHVIFEKEITTREVVAFKDLAVGKEGVEFDFVWNESTELREIISITLLRGDEKVSEFEVASKAVSGLLSDTEYRLVVEYRNNGGVERIEQIFKTEAKAVPEIEMTLPTHTQTSISFDVMETDTDEVGAVSKIELYLGETLVKTAESTDLREFDGLLSNNKYTVNLTYVYDLNNGKGEQTVEKNVDITTDAKSTPTVEFDNPTKTQTSVSFDIVETDTDEVGAISKIELYLGEALVEAAESTDLREFDGLLSNNEYTVKLIYTYNLNDGTGNQNIEQDVMITTMAKSVPELSLAFVETTQSSLSFNLLYNDVDNVGRITSLELLHNGVTVMSGISTRKFNGLLSDNSYTVKASFEYDLNDGQGKHNESRVITATTEAKQAPVFTIGDMDLTEYTANGHYSYTDIDGTLKGYVVELYKDGELVSKNGNQKISFDSLSYYTDYCVKITYKYDLDDGNGVRTGSVSSDIKTMPYVDVMSTKIINTSGVSSGETIFMQAEIDNPLGGKIGSVVVNGQTYNTATSSTANRIFVEIKNNGQFAGGDTPLTIEQLNIELNNTTYGMKAKTTCTSNAFINGTLEVISVEFVNENYEPIDWCFTSEQVYAMITVYNPTGYDINKVVADWIIGGNYFESCDITDITKIDNSRYIMSVDWMVHDIWSEIGLSGISYSNQYLSKTMTLSNICDGAVRVASDEVRYVSTYEDLLTMNEGFNYYELTNDIDLAGMEWYGNEFMGVFNGNGYSIKNMSVVGSLKNANYNLGLFSTASGFISNVNIENAMYIVDFDADIDGDFSVFCGAIAGRNTGTDVLVIQNCTVDENSIFNVSSREGMSGHVYVGGIIGLLESYSSFAGISNSGIYDCTNRGSVSGGYRTGGIAGVAIANIDGCENHGDVTGYEKVGGIAGNCSSNISNSTNYGNVSFEAQLHMGTCFVGGISADGGNIKECTNNGNIIVCDPLVYVWAGGISAQPTSVKNSINNGDINIRGGQNNILIGGIGWGSVYGIENCINTGDITVAECESMVGVSGISFAGNSDINNCVNVGEITVSSTKTFYIASAFLNRDASLLKPSEIKEAKNCYAKVIYEDDAFYDIIPCDNTMLNSKGFYTDALCWSEDIWDFSDLDFENGKYPKLK